MDRAWDFLHNRKRAYQQTFGSPWGQEVLRDLARFARARSTTFDADPRVHALKEGRREVFQRIADHMNLSTEELYTITTGKTVNFNKE